MNGEVNVHWNRNSLYQQVSFSMGRSVNVLFVVDCRLAVEYNFDEEESE